MLQTAGTRHSAKIRIAGRTNRAFTLRVRDWRWYFQPIRWTPDRRPRITRICMAAARSPLSQPRIMAHTTSARHDDRAHPLYTVKSSDRDADGTATMDAEQEHERGTHHPAARTVSGLARTVTPEHRITSSTPRPRRFRSKSSVRCVCSMARWPARRLRAEPQSETVGARPDV